MRTIALQNPEPRNTAMSVYCMESFTIKRESRRSLKVQKSKSLTSVPAKNYIVHHQSTRREVWVGRHAQFAIFKVLTQSRSQSPRYPRPAVGNEGLWDKAFTGKQESCDRSNCAGVRYSHIRFYQMESLFHEAIEFSMEKLGMKVLMKEQYDALLKSYMCRKKVCWWHCRQVSENRLSDFTLDVRLHSKRLWGKILLLS